ncbi:hypothetical protein [Falsibacillus pallidus]|uniref:hypothetical protein n=1 Tax=Falsibacillus pallidus TaxID=493781 RepID=UPI003D995515
MNNENSPKYTSAGTNIDEVKRQNANSGLTYNQVKKLIADTVSGHEVQNFNAQRTE